MELESGNIPTPDDKPNTSGVNGVDSKENNSGGGLDENQSVRRPNKDNKNNNKFDNKGNTDDKLDNKDKNKDDNKLDTNDQNQSNNDGLAGDDKSEDFGNNKQLDPASVAKKGLKHQAMKAGAQGGANATLGAAIISKIMAFLKMMQGLMGSAMSAVSGLIAQILGVIMNVVNSVVSFFSGLLGLSSTAVQVALIAVLILTGLGGVGVGAAILNNDGYKDGIIESCTAEAEKQLNDAEDAEFNDGANDMLENAQKIYSVFKQKGLGDMQIAGILANYETESSIDPTTVEGAYGTGEKYTITGPKTAKALKDLNKYTLEVLFPMYGDYPLNRDAYKASDGKYYPGIGIVQWTGGGAKNFMDAADAAGIPWYTMDYQMAYMIQKGAPTGFADFWNKYKNEKFNNAGDAALYFAKNYEGHVIDNEPRAKAATKWMNSIKNYEVDEAYANNILTLANDTSAQSTEDVKSNIIKNCVQAAESEHYQVTDVGIIDTESKYYNSDNPFTSASCGQCPNGVLWGQCTWFVWGRIYEKLGIKTHSALGNGSQWYATAKAMSPAEQAKWGIKGTGKEIKPNSAVSMVNSFSDAGHVAFIEKIQGNTVWISEGNIGGVGKTIVRQYPLDKLKKENTIGYGQGQIQGFVYY